VQVRRGGVGWNFEWNFYQRGHGEGSMQVFVLPTGEPAM
jgi:hypothetical protein